jgi:hypothetical protein
VDDSPAVGSIKVDDAGASLTRLIEEATESLKHLDAGALEERGRRAEAMAALNLGGAGVSSRAMVAVLEARFRLFTALLKATEDNLATLRRAETQESFGAESFGRQGFGASGALPLNGYAAPRGLFESLGLYGEEEAVDSIWPRGRVAQARARANRVSSGNPTIDNGTERT